MAPALQPQHLLVVSIPTIAAILITYLWYRKKKFLPRNQRDPGGGSNSIGSRTHLPALPTVLAESESSDSSCSISVPFNSPPNVILIQDIADVYSILQKAARDLETASPIEEEEVASDVEEEGSQYFSLSRKISYSRQLSIGADDENSSPSSLETIDMAADKAISCLDQQNGGCTMLADITNNNEANEKTSENPTRSRSSPNDSRGERYQLVVASSLEKRMPNGNVCMREELLSMEHLEDLTRDNSFHNEVTEKTEQLVGALTESRTSQTDDIVKEEEEEEEEEHPDNSARNIALQNGVSKEETPPVADDNQIIKNISESTEEANKVDHKTKELDAEKLSNTFGQLNLEKSDMQQSVKSDIEENDDAAKEMSVQSPTKQANDKKSPKNKNGIKNNASTSPGSPAVSLADEKKSEKQFDSKISPDIKDNNSSSSSSSAGNSSMSKWARKRHKKAVQRALLLQDAKDGSPTTATEKKVGGVSGKNINKVGPAQKIVNDRDNGPRSSSRINGDLEERMSCDRSERDSANHSPVDAILDNQGSHFSDVRSEHDNNNYSRCRPKRNLNGSSDSGKGFSEGAATPTPCSIAEGEVDAVLLYQFEIPQEHVGKLIGKLGTFINRIKHQSNAAMFIKEHPHTTSLKLVAVKGTQHEINTALDIIRKRFPESEYPDITLDEYHDLPLPIPCPLRRELCQLELVEGVNNDVVISSLVTAGHMFLQQPMHPTNQSLNALNMYMNTAYNSPDAPPMLVAPSPDVVVAAPAMDGWYRAQIISVDEDGESCDVRFLDYGGYLKIPCSGLRALRAEFLNLPFQAVECILANTVPVGGVWSEEAKLIVQSLTVGQILQAQVLDYTENGLPLILLYVIFGSQVILINDELIARGFAFVPAPPCIPTAAEEVMQQEQPAQYETDQITA